MSQFSHLLLYCEWQHCDYLILDELCSSKHLILKNKLLKICHEQLFSVVPLCINRAYIYYDIFDLARRQIWGKNKKLEM